MKIKSKLHGARNFILGFMTCMILFTLVMTVGANTGRRTETVNITYDNIRIVINGQPTTLRDLQGNPIEPFLMDGTMFVPISPLVRQFGHSSTYVASTRTLYIGPMPRETVSLLTAVPAFEVSNPGFQGMRIMTATINMLGNPYSNVMRLSHSHGNAWTHHNLNGQFNTITGTIGRIDGSNHGRSTVSFTGEGRELAVFNVDGSTRPFEISVDVTGVSILRIQINVPVSGAQPAIAHSMIE